MDRIRTREKIESAHNLEKLEQETDALIWLAQDKRIALQEQRQRGMDEDDEFFIPVEAAEKDIERIHMFADEIRGYYDSIEEQVTHQFDGAIESNQKAIEEAETLMQQNLTNIEANNTAITKKSTAHQLKLDEAEKLFLQTQDDLKAQAQAVVNEFRKDEDTKEIDAIKKKYKEIIGLTEENSTDRKELIEERDALILEITKRDENELLDVIKKNQDELSKLNKSAEELEIEALNTKYQVMIDKAIELGVSEVEIERMKQEEINRVKGEYADIEKEEEKARNEATIDAAVDMMNSLLSLSNTKAEKEKKQLESDFKNGLISEKKYNRELLKIEEEQLRKEKKAALIQIGVDTARGISGAVSAGAGLVFPANLAAIATGVAAVLGGVAQAAGVLGQSVDGVNESSDDSGGNNSGGDLAGDIPGLPTFGAITSDAPPVQAYVVESDVSTAQALQNELDLQSTL